MKKPYWKNVLDKARTAAEENPHRIASEDLKNGESFSKTHEEFVNSINARGWKFQLSRLLIDDGIDQWYFSGTLDPVDRPFDIHDMNFLAKAAHYVGAPLEETKVLIGKPDQPIHFCWVEENL